MANDVQDAGPSQRKRARFGSRAELLRSGE